MGKVITMGRNHGLINMGQRSKRFNGESFR